MSKRTNLLYKVFMSQWMLDPQTAHAASLVLGDMIGAARLKAKYGVMEYDDEGDGDGSRPADYYHYYGRHDISDCNYNNYTDHYNNTCPHYYHNRASHNDFCSSSRHYYHCLRSCDYNSSSYGSFSVSYNNYCCKAADHRRYRCPRSCKIPGEHHK